MFNYISKAGFAEKPQVDPVEIPKDGTVMIDGQEQWMFEVCEATVTYGERGAEQPLASQMMIARHVDCAVCRASIQFVLPIDYMDPDECFVAICPICSTSNMC